MKQINFLLPVVYVADTKGRGRGVYTFSFIAKDTIIEEAPVIVMTASDRVHLDQTLLHDYIFEWGPKSEECAMALGLVPVYNHSYAANCEYEMEFKKALIRIKAIRDIEAGEELFINYNGDWNDEKPVWFDAI